MQRPRTLLRRTIHLGWPITIQQFLNTLMRTVDILVTGMFSPAAVAAIGLADIYTGILRRVGGSLGTAAIAIASQDTGRGASTSRDDAISQALIIGAVTGVPFVILGLLFGHQAIAVLGADAEVVRLGGLYLMIIFLVAPMRIVGTVATYALQGTGDTRTPMLISGVANLLNIIATVGLGLGIGLLPRMGILGVGLATAGSRVFVALAILGALYTTHTDPELTRPADIILTRQLLGISLPRFAELMVTTLVAFPFNALLLTFGTEVNAAYHIGRRITQQIAAPLYRTFSSVSSIVVGQLLGEGKPSEAQNAGYVIAIFGLGTVGVISLGVMIYAPRLVTLFTNDEATIGYAVAFTRTYAIVSVAMLILFVFAGGLRSAGDTRTPLYARFTGHIGLMLGFSYLSGVLFGFGLLGVYTGIVLAYIWAAIVVALKFISGNWTETAAALIEARKNVVDSK
ncbi:MATE family efflux transporter [Halobellus captivus]|uniref:MATE family efflux transporter n=1 Tax=Halobellus captivus TaxID=2592614 RepID=UPI001EF10C47|nr:MATE family efflux transporter [Halobellus captivus]